MHDIVFDPTGTTADHGFNSVSPMSESLEVIHEP